MISDDERDFLAHNASHYACYAVRELLNWMVANIVGIHAPAERNECLRRCAADDRPTGLPEPVAELISHHAPAVAIMNDFYWNLFGVSRERPLSRGNAGIVPDGWCGARARDAVARGWGRG